MKTNRIGLGRLKLAEKLNRPDLRALSQFRTQGSAYLNGAK
jgi:hypothetical protein